MILGLMWVELFLLSDGIGFGKNVINFAADMISSAHIDNRKNVF